MTKDELNAALKKFHLGNSLSDVELNGLAFMFNRMRDDLQQAANHFEVGYGLVYRDVYYNAEKLRSFQIARRNK